MVLGKYCFDVDAFATDEFSVATFLEDCRARNPMETVHQDLRDFQTSLENQVRPCVLALHWHGRFLLCTLCSRASCARRLYCSQLVAIINEDYAEFLQLSSKLKGVDEAVSSVRAPILAILKRVDLVQQALVRCTACTTRCCPMRFARACCSHTNARMMPVDRAISRQRSTRSSRHSTRSGRKNATWSSASGAPLQPRASYDRQSPMRSRASLSLSLGSRSDCCSSKSSSRSLSRLTTQTTQSNYSPQHQTIATIH